MTDLPQIENLLRERTRFRRLVHRASCPSTQDLAAQDPERDEAVFWADHQTAGRGRQKREWHDEPGADLAVTFRIRAPLPSPLALPAAVPVVVVLATEPLAGRELRIKWPNDVFLDGRKLAGVLIDAGVGGADTYLVGIGVNCNRVRFPLDLEASATSLALANGREVRREDLLLALAVGLSTAVDALLTRRYRDLEDVFRSRLALLGRRVEVQAGETRTGVLTGLDFAELELDGSDRLPLGIVRAIRAAP